MMFDMKCAVAVIGSAVAGTVGMATMSAPVIVLQLRR